LKLEEVVLSTEQFILTHSHLLPRNRKAIPFIEIDSIVVEDNKDKVNIGRWIAIIVISAGIFIYDILSKGHVEDAFIIVLIACGIIFFAISDLRKTKLIVTTTSGDQHIVVEGTEAVYQSVKAIQVAVTLSKSNFLQNKNRSNSTNL